MKETKISDPELGAGIYTIPDVAFILRLPQAKVRRWMKEFWDGRLGKDYEVKYSHGEGREKVTKFHTLIEFYVFYQLRELGISTKQIFLAHRDISSQLNTAYPFASSKVLSDGKSILFELNDGTLVNADESKQSVFKEIIESFCKKIEFSSTDIAQCFYPMGRDKHIVVDPHHQFGQPTIENTNILAETIFDLFKAGESIDFLARLYQLPIKEIKDAITFYTPKSAA
ncbi:DUF433 domain-containing protein [Pedobacter psychroterrae]|uniref:DUF433 domain-containing protein n=1 Tax=Pedobacter psychroterrae TaxID=2530453 RepID=A0A4R0NNX8_9SPHI|nr:DUF433 domain-containing protein [Pedobacter psychroterrae]TCD00895.1 DUF433 domain-containing protein [Pedobacter psychroterrae]